MSPLDWTDGSDARLAHARGESPDDPREASPEQPCCELATYVAGVHSRECVRHDPATCPTCRMEEPTP